MDLELDNFIMNLDRAPESVAENGMLFVAFKKLAEIMEEPPEEAAPAGEPVEDMAAMAPDPLALMAAAAAQAMRCQFNCLYYAETVRGSDRETVKRLCDSLSWRLRDDASHLFRKMAVLTNGAGVPMPPVPAPDPVTDSAAALTAIATCHQQYLVTLQTLMTAVEGDPLAATLQQMLQDHERWSDDIALSMPAPKKGLAAAVKKAAAKIAPDPTVDIAAQEMALALQQAKAETAFYANAAQQANTVAVQNATEAETAQAQAQINATTAESASMQAQEATAQAQAATEQAAMAEENAAQQADAKMRLSMRIQQFRQQLADIVSQDPVAEEALGFGEMAGAGSPATAAQQEQAALEDQAMAEEEAMAGAERPKPKASKAVPKAEPKEPKTAAPLPFRTLGAVGGLGGAALGATTGALTSSKGHRLEDAGRGALAGGAVGGAVGALSTIPARKLIRSADALRDLRGWKGPGVDEARSSLLASAEDAQGALRLGAGVGAVNAASAGVLSRSRKGAKKGKEK